MKPIYMTLLLTGSLLASNAAIAQTAAQRAAQQRAQQQQIIEQARLNEQRRISQQAAANAAAKAAAQKAAAQQARLAADRAYQQSLIDKSLANRSSSTISKPGVITGYNSPSGSGYSGYANKPGQASPHTVMANSYISKQAHAANAYHNMIVDQHRSMGVGVCRTVAYTAKGQKYCMN
jgi:hypothetical protein